jgi:hypothetical protein
MQTFLKNITIDFNFFLAVEKSFLKIFWLLSFFPEIKFVIVKIFLNCYYG